MNKTFKNIHYSKVGQGPHLCFLHGFCEDSTIWNSIVKELEYSYTIICVDLPGFGQSGAGGVKSIADSALIINQILVSEGAFNCILFGHSMGGYIVSEYLNQFGEQLIGAAYVHSTARADSEGKKDNRTKTIEFIKKNGTEGFFPLFIQSLVSETNLKMLKDYLYKLVKQTSTISIINGLESMRAREDRLKTLEEFNKPVLFILGDEDAHYSKQEIYNQVSACSLVQISVLENVGHLSMYEDPKNCLMSIKQFLKMAELYQA